jgi:hypothetical protein
MATIICEYQDSSTNIFSSTLNLTSINICQQQYYNGFIYGATSSYLFKYNINLLSASVKYTTNTLQISTFTIYNNTLYWINSSGNIYSIDTDLSSNFVNYSLSSTVGYALTGTRVLAYNNTTNKLVWCNGTTVYTITLTNNLDGTGTGAVSFINTNIPTTINGLVIESGIPYYFCITTTDYTIYTLSGSVSTAYYSNSIADSYSYLWDGTTRTNLTYKNGICYLSYNFLSFSVTNQFYIESFTLSSPESIFNLTEITGGVEPYTQVQPMGLPFDDNYILYVSIVNEPAIWVSTTPLCFNEGTKILCLNQELMDEYNAIEFLKIGDFVKTYKHGYRKIHKVIQGSFKNNPKKWNMCMYKMVKTLTNGLTDDLIVTGGHSLLVDAISDEEQKRYDEMGIPSFSKSTIDNKHLLLSCCSDQFAPMQDTNLYNYYHLLLENNDDEEERFGIWANGILTETPNVKTIKSK